MSITTALIVSEVFSFDPDEGATGDALVTVDASGVTIAQFGADDPVAVVFSRAEWEAINKMAQREWAEPTMGGRE